MGKTLLYRLLGIGRVPARERAAFEAEGVVFMDEGLSGSITLKHYRAPWRRCSWRKVWFSGSLVLTERRFAAFAFSKPLVNVPLDDPRLASLEVSAPREGVFCVAFEAADFRDDQSGRVECRWKASRAAELVDRLTGGAV